METIKKIASKAFATLAIIGWSLTSTKKEVEL